MEFRDFPARFQNEERWELKHGDYVVNRRKILKINNIQAYARYLNILNLHQNEK